MKLLKKRGDYRAALAAHGITCSMSKKGVTSVGALCGQLSVDARSSVGAPALHVGLLDVDREQPVLLRPIALRPLAPSVESAAKHT